LFSTFVRVCEHSLCGGQILIVVKVEQNKQCHVLCVIVTHTMLF